MKEIVTRFQALKLTLTLILVSFQAISTERLVLSGIKDSIDGKITEEVMKSAYAIGSIDIHVQFLPSDRAIKLSSSGEVDGELFRAENAVKNFPDLVKVPTPIHYVRAMIATKDESGITQISDLSSRKVGIVRDKFYQSITQGMFTHKKYSIHLVDRLHKNQKFCSPIK